MFPTSVLKWGHSELTYFVHNKILFVTFFHKATHHVPQKKKRRNLFLGKISFHRYLTQCLPWAQKKGFCGCHFIMVPFSPKSNHRANALHDDYQKTFSRSQSQTPFCLLRLSKSRLVLNFSLEKFCQH